MLTNQHFIAHFWVGGGGITNVINQQVIINSISNVTIVSGRQFNDVLMQANVSGSTMHLQEKRFTLS